jgi:hypothetical protein
VARVRRKEPGDADAQCCAPGKRRLKMRQTGSWRESVAVQRGSAFR